jgi:hypothetical protein
MDSKNIDGGEEYSGGNPGGGNKGVSADEDNTEILDSMEPSPE